MAPIVTEFSGGISVVSCGHLGVSVINCSMSEAYGRVF